MAVMLCPQRRIPRPENPRKALPLPQPIPSMLSWAAGFDVEGTSTGISLVVGAPPGRWTIEGPDGEPLGNARPLPELSFRMATSLSFSQRGGRSPTIGLRRNACREYALGTTTARRTSWRWIGQASACSGKERFSEMGETNSFVHGRDLTGWKIAGPGTTVWKSRRR